jgi:type I restriction enzyme S subunit
MNKNWEMKKLGEVIKLEYGKPLPDSKRKSDGAYPVYGANGEKDRTDEYYYDKQSIIVGRKGSAGEINLTENKFWPLDVTYFVTFDSKKYDLYFVYYLLSKLELQKLAKGVKPGINRNEVYSINVQIPQLPEQKHIVSILDETFAAIDKAKENAEKNLQNSRELFDSYLQSVFANSGNGWERKKLGSISTKIGSGATPSGGKESYKTTGISLIRSLNVHDRKFKEEKLAFLDEKQADKLSNVIVEKNDVLLNITGASIARCCIVPTEYLPARVNQHVSIIRTNQDILISSFLNYLLTSKVYKDQLLNTGEKGGSTRQAITKAQIQDFSIYFPSSTEEQQSIVAKLDSLSAETKRLEAIYQQKLAALDELKKSVLQKAFNGELTGA